MWTIVAQWVRSARPGQRSAIFSIDVGCVDFTSACD